MSALQQTLITAKFSLFGNFLPPFPPPLSLNIPIFLHLHFHSRPLPLSIFFSTLPIFFFFLFYQMSLSTRLTPRHNCVVGGGRRSLQVDVYRQRLLPDCFEDHASSGIERRRALSFDGRRRVGRRVPDGRQLKEIVRLDRGVDVGTRQRCSVGGGNGEQRGCRRHNVGRRRPITTRLHRRRLVTTSADRRRSVARLRRRRAATPCDWQV